MSSQAYIFQINRSPGGVPKTAVFSGEVTPLGLAGDKQRNRRFHGGPQRALCLYPLELILALQAEGHPIYPGATGENITTFGVDFAGLSRGDRLRLGPVLIEITSYAAPCKNIRGAFKDDDFSRISAKIHPGESRLYARVLEPGTITVGDRISVLPRA